MIEAMGLNEETAQHHPLSVGHRPWVIFPGSSRQNSSKFFGMMVARDGVEPPPPAFSGL